MKILFLLTQDLESPSGLGRYLPLAQELVKAGHQVEIAALHSNYQGITEKRFQINGLDVHYVAPMHVKKQGSTKSYYSPLRLIGIILWSTWALTKAAVKSTADVIHIAKPHPMNSVAGLIAKYLRGKPLFLDCDDYEAGSNRFRGRWQQMVVAFFEKHTPKFAKLTTTNTHFMQEKLISWGVPKDQIVYLPNGIDPDRFTDPDPHAIECLVNELNLKNRHVVAYIGSLSLPSHPVDLLLFAFKEVLQHFPNTILLVVGGGEDHQTLQNLAGRLEIQAQTRFIGRVLPNEVPLYYRLANITVDPVYNNDAARGRSPLKLFESWICEVPFVTSDIGDRADLIGSPPAGVIVPPEDPNLLAKALIKLLDSPIIARDYVERGRTAVQHYRWDELSQGIIEQYLQVVQNE